MKNFFKFLGIIALVTVIGFSMAACEEESSNSGDPDDQKEGVKWPTEFTFAEDSYSKFGTWVKDSVPLTFYQADTIGWVVLGASIVTGTSYNLSAVDGKKITVEVDDGSNDIAIFCESYTLEDDTLTFTGGTGKAADINGEWVKQGS